MDRVQRITGHPQPVQHQVDSDLAATLTGPAALNQALRGRTKPQLEACYRALLDRAWQDRTTATRQAVYRAAAVEADNERRATRRGGNR